MLKEKLTISTKKILIPAVFVMVLLLSIFNLVLPNSVKANDIVSDISSVSLELSDINNENSSIVDNNKEEFILNNNDKNNDKNEETDLVENNNNISATNEYFSDFNKIKFNDYSNSEDIISLSKGIFNVYWGYPNCEKQAIEKTNDKVTI